MGLDSFHVSIVSFASVRITGAVTGGEKSRCVVSDKGKEEHDGRTSHPSELSSGPSQGQNP